MKLNFIFFRVKNVFITNFVLFGFLSTNYDELHMQLQGGSKVTTSGKKK